MRLRTKKFLKEKFKEYYSQKKPRTPPSFEEREWGIIFLDENFPEKTVMKRHKSFSTKKELKTYLESMTPAHVYFSSAYYKRPSASTMEKKGWKGADLVFDLDADHLDRTKELSYKEMLEEVKKETINLLNNFLKDDLGIEQKHIEVVFSGGRGYHIHVRDKRIKELNSQERREIIDYLFGNGLNTPIKEKKQRGTNIYSFSTEKSNWNQKIKKYITQKYLMEIRKKNKEEAIKELTHFNGVGEVLAERIHRFLQNKKNIDKIKKKGKLDIVKGISKSFWQQLIEKAKKEIKAEADEPVTSDIKRLIRYPTSLHGGTGFRVTPIEPKEIKEFDPFKDAVVFNDNKVRVYPKKNYTTKMKENEIKVKKGEIKEIPEYAAVFLSCIEAIEVEGW